MIKFFTFIAFFTIAVETLPKLLITKQSNSILPIQFVEHTIEYNIYNIANEDVLNVELDDRDSYPTNFFSIIHGSANVNFAAIPARSNLSHVLIIVPNKSGEFNDKEAKLSYHETETNEMHTVKSNSKGKYIVYDNKVYNVFISKNHVFLVFGSLTIPITVLSALLYLKSSSRYENSKVMKKK